MQSVASGLKAKDISLRGNKSFPLIKLLFSYNKCLFLIYLDTFFVYKRNQ